MPPFSRPPEFSMSEVPSLDFCRGPVSVDIGFLANEAHTNSFVAIFEKLLQDNDAALHGCTLVSVAGKHPITDYPLSISLLISFEVLAKKARELAVSLYFSKNDEVILTFTRSSESKALFVVFDNPYFRFQ